MLSGEAGRHLVLQAGTKHIESTGVADAMFELMKLFDGAQLAHAGNVGFQQVKRRVV